MIKKFIFSVFIVTLCLICSLSFDNCVFIKPVNPNEVKSTINYLSSNEFNGRLAGTIENYETVKFIKNYFEIQGLKSYSNNNYLDGFNVLYPKKIDGTPTLIVKDKNGFIVKYYKYGVDYKEDMLNFKNNNISFKKNNIIVWRGNNFQVQKGNNYFLFYTPKDDKLNFRSSFIANSPHSMYIMIKKRTSQELKQYIDSGYEVNCFIPFENKLTSIYNVLGYIEGKNPNLPPLILSAHFDHVGSDLSGKVYNGALDNASGTSLMLELIKYINSMGKPDRNIIFAAFNAEEFGCLGSKDFVKKYKQNLKGSKVLNFDMIGSNRNVPISIMGGKWDNKNLNFIKEISNLCRKNNTDFKYEFENASDHEYFRAYGIDALTLSDADMSKIHTPMDKSSYISTKSINRCFKIISGEINKYGFHSNPLLIYYKSLFIISLTGMITTSIIYTKNNRRYY